MARLGAVLIIGLAALPAAATAPAASGQAIEQFLKTGVPFCMKAPAAQCIDRGFAFADRDGSRKLSLAEVKETQAEVNRWTKANAKRLPAQERERLAMLELRTYAPARRPKAAPAHS